ncbi:Uu.00g020330.m01.CDS01 [Anthostomella pinea]|uniref:Uu.00g020330.m01.CDS01 n=1 Tax=Anthostomella pinea TaxID=933095 RepID=A0AAI8VZF9_9PEZI|nr:Uu.00g020330.m01.CDS01 [Anthostomella pinea]
MAKTKKAPDSPTRNQPRRAVRDGVQKPKGNPAPNFTGKPRGHAAKKIKKNLKAMLNKKVDAMNPDDVWLDKSGLLGMGSALGQPSPITAKSPRMARKGRKNRKRNTPKTEKFMDDILMSDDEPEDSLQRSERWIPDMELRRRPSEKPAHMPHVLWMSYYFLDEYIYRQSLTA